MKWAVRVALALAALVAVAGIAAVLALPGLVESESVRSRIERAAHDATGRDLHYESLEFGLFPPSLRVMGARVSGETPDAEALLEAAEISLRVALLPLLARTVLIDSLVVDAATLRLVRGPNGLVLPESPQDSERSAAPAEHSDGESGPSFDLGVRSVQLRSSTLRLVDRSVRPAVTWELTDLDATARGESLEAPIALDLGGTLASGGALTVSGSVTAGGELDLEVSLDAVQMAALASYLGDDVEVAGALSGDVRLRGPAAALEQLVASLRGTDVRFRRGDTSLAGELTLDADVAMPTHAPAGSFELDASDAALELGAGFTKPPGVPARVTGRIAAGAGGVIAVDDVRLVIRNFEAQGRVNSLSPFSVELIAPAFELEGWEALVPALATARPSGEVRIEGLRFASEPADLRGSVHLDGVVLHAREGAAITLRGAVAGHGNALRSEGMSVELAGQVAQLDLRVSELFAQPRYELALKAHEADSNQLFTDLLSKPDTLYGPLELDLDLAGGLGGDPLQSLTGTVDFGVEPGRLVGVSLLRAVFDRLGTAGSLVVNLGKVFGGRDLQRFYGDEFELLSGALTLRDGIAHANDLTLRYRGYAVRLEGTLALADLGLDMSGELTLHEELDAAIAQELSLSDYQPRQRVVPLARVGGTLDAPKVALDSEVAIRFAGAYATDAYAGKLRDRAERELGPAAGDLVEQGLSVLEGLLGGGHKRPVTPPAEPPTSDPSAGS